METLLRMKPIFISIALLFNIKITMLASIIKKIISVQYMLLGNASIASKNRFPGKVFFGVDRVWGPI